MFFFKFFLSRKKQTKNTCINDVTYEKLYMLHFKNWRKKNKTLLMPFFLTFRQLSFKNENKIPCKIIKS